MMFLLSIKKYVAIKIYRSFFSDELSFLTRRWQRGCSLNSSSPIFKRKKKFFFKEQGK